MSSPERISENLKLIDSKKYNLRKAILKLALEWKSLDEQLDSNEKYVEGCLTELECSEKNVDSVRESVVESNTKLELVRKSIESRVEELESKEREFLCFQKMQIEELELKHKQLETIRRSAGERIKEAELREEGLNEQLKSMEGLLEKLDMEKKQFDHIRKSISKRLEAISSKERYFKSRWKELELKERKIDSAQKLNGEWSEKLYSKKKPLKSVQKLKANQKLFEERSKELELKKKEIGTVRSHQKVDHNSNTPPRQASATATKNCWKVISGGAATNKPGIFRSIEVGSKPLSKTRNSAEVGEGSITKMEEDGLANNEGGKEGVGSAKVNAVKLGRSVTSRNTSRKRRLTVTSADTGDVSIHGTGGSPAGQKIGLNRVHHCEGSFCERQHVSYNASLGDDDGFLSPPKRLRGNESARDSKEESFNNGSFNTSNSRGFSALDVAKEGTKQKGYAHSQGSFPNRSSGVNGEETVMADCNANTSSSGDGGRDKGKEVLSDEEEEDVPMTKAAKARKAYEKGIDKKSVRCERQVDAVTLEINSVIIAVIKNNGLDHFFKEVTGYFTPFVKEFYKNMEFRPHHDMIVSSVRNRRVEVTPETIAEMWKYKQPEGRTITYPRVGSAKMVVPLREMVKNVNALSGDAVRVGDLKDDHAMMNKAMHYNLFPRCNEKVLNNTGKEFLNAIMQDNERVDFAKWVYYQIATYPEESSPTSALPYGNLITRICEKQGVKRKPGEVLERGNPGPITGSCLNKRKANQAEPTYLSQVFKSPPKNLTTMQKVEQILSWLVCRTEEVGDEQKIAKKERNEMLKNQRKIMKEQLRQGKRLDFVLEVTKPYIDEEYKTSFEEEEEENDEENEEGVEENEEEEEGDEIEEDDGGDE